MAGNLSYVDDRQEVLVWVPVLDLYSLLEAQAE
jgi:hypothetical protein